MIWIPRFSAPAAAKDEAYGPLALRKRMRLTFTEATLNSSDLNRTYEKEHKTNASAKD